MPEDPVEEQEVPPSAKGGWSLGKIALIVGLALLSSAVGGVVSFVLITRTLNGQAQGTDVDRSKEAEQERIAAMLQKSAVLPLDPFVVNLADPDAARYLRIKDQPDGRRQIESKRHIGKSGAPTESARRHSSEPDGKDFP